MGIACPKVDRSVVNRRRPVDPRLACRVIPFFPARCRIYRVSVTVSTPDVNRSINDRRRRLKANLVITYRVFTGLESPFFDTGDSVECVEVTVPAADIKRVIPDRGRGVDASLCFEFPLNNAGALVKR